MDPIDFADMNAALQILEMTPMEPQQWPSACAAPCGCQAMFWIGMHFPMQDCEEHEGWGSW